MKIDTIVNQPVIETERLILRPLRRSDAGPLSIFAADERVAQMTRDIAHPLPPGAIESLIANALADDRTEDVWVLDGSAGGNSALLGRSR